MFNGLTSSSHMSLPEAGYGSEEGQLGSEISGAVSGVTTPGASRLQALQLQERSATMQRLHKDSTSFSNPNAAEEALKERRAQKQEAIDEEGKKTMEDSPPYSPLEEKEVTGS